MSRKETRDCRRSDCRGDDNLRFVTHSAWFYSDRVSEGSDQEMPIDVCRSIFSNILTFVAFLVIVVKTLKMVPRIFHFSRFRCAVIAFPAFLKQRSRLNGLRVVGNSTPRYHGTLIRCI